MSKVNTKISSFFSFYFPWLEESEINVNAMDKAQQSLRDKTNNDDCHSKWRINFLNKESKKN